MEDSEKITRREYELACADIERVAARMKLLALHPNRVGLECLPQLTGPMGVVFAWAEQEMSPANSDAYQRTVAALQAAQDVAPGNKAGILPPQSD